MGKTESIFAYLQSGPKTTEAISAATKLTAKQIHNLMKHHVQKGAVQKNGERWHLIDSVQQKINEAVAFLESHGYEFD